VRNHAGTRAAAAPLAALLILIASTAAPAADPIIPGDVQAVLIVRILDYDRALKTWAPSGLTVGVVARRVQSVSKFIETLGGRDVQGLPIRVVEHAYKDAASFKAWIEQADVRLLYVCPDLAADTALVLSAGADRQVPTLVPTRAQFENGGTLGLIVRDEKPHILVHLTASRAVGMNLDPKLLQLSEVVR
jgi:hypothetical protein